MISKTLADGNKLGRVLAATAIVAALVWLGRIYTGGASCCPVALLTGHCPFDSAH